MADALVLPEHRDGLAVLTLNRPDKLNAINQPMIEALNAHDARVILPKYLGEKYHRLYGTCRREEDEHLHAEISDRDYDWCLRAV